MNKQVIIGVSAGGGILLLLIIFVIIAWMAGNRNISNVGSSVGLMETALNGSSIEEKEKAAADLARSDRPDATEFLLEVLNQTKDPEVLIPVMDGLGHRAGDKKDIKARECMPRLVDILEDEKGKLAIDDATMIKKVRGHACTAMNKITGTDYGWTPDLDQEDDEVRLKLKETISMGRFYIKNPPPPMTPQ